MTMPRPSPGPLRHPLSPLLASIFILLAGSAHGGEAGKLFKLEDFPLKRATPVLVEGSFTGTMAKDPVQLSITDGQVRAAIITQAGFKALPIEARLERSINIAQLCISAQATDKQGRQIMLSLSQKLAKGGRLEGVSEGTISIILPGREPQTKVIEGRLTLASLARLPEAPADDVREETAKP